METFQENLEHQKRGKGNRQIAIAPRDGLARPPVGQRSRRRDNEVVRSNGPGNGPRDSGSAARPRPSAASRRAHEGRRTCPEGSVAEPAAAAARAATRDDGDLPPPTTTTNHTRRPLCAPPLGEDATRPDRELLVRHARPVDELVHDQSPDT